MSTLRGTAQRTLGTPIQITVRPITLALAALLIGAAFVLAIAVTGQSNLPTGVSKSVRVAPSAPIPPSPAERHQQAGVDGPGMRP